MSTLERKAELTLLRQLAKGKGRFFWNKLVSGLQVKVGYLQPDHAESIVKGMKAAGYEGWEVKDTSMLFGPAQPLKRVVKTFTR